MNTQNAKALILLSTYNGEKYLAEQIESIISQTYTDWVLLIRDDGSTDATLKIIQDFCHKDARIQYIKDALDNQRVPNCFGVLMEHAKERAEEFIFFCDQDDVWLPHKLMLQMNALQALDQTEPLLVHTDLCVVDQNLTTIHPSFLRHENLAPNLHRPIETLLSNNYVTGCTIGFNKKLLLLATPFPKDIIMHDWWCALCAGALGKVIFINQATVLYRQHGNNSIGSKGFYAQLSFKKLFKCYSCFIRKLKRIRIGFKQVHALHERISQQGANPPLIDDYLNLLQQSFFKRYENYFKLKLRFTNRVQKVLFFLCLGLV